MIPGIQEIQSLATKYNKQQLAHMAQMGLIDPTKAVMAGMMISRIEAQNQQPPTTTVAQDVLTPPAPQPQQAQPQQPQAPQMGMNGAPQTPTAGIAGLSSGIQGMAGGGIVAFDGGGRVSQEEQDRADLLDALRKTGAAAKDIFSMPVRGVAGAAESLITRPLRAVGVPVPYLPDSFYGGDRESMTPYMDAITREQSATPATTPTAVTPVAGQAFPQQTDQQRLARRQEVVGSAPAPKAPAQPRRELPKIEAPVTAKDSGVKAFTPELMKKDPNESVAEFKARKDAAAKEFGVDPDYYKNKEAKVGEEREALKGERKDAFNMALINAGLGIAAGKSQNALQNIGEGAKAGVESYRADVKDIKARDRLLAASEEAARDAEYARTIGDAAGYAKAVEDKKNIDRSIDQTNLGAKNTAGTAYTTAQNSMAELQAREAGANARNARTEAGADRRNAATVGAQMEMNKARMALYEKQMASADAATKARYAALANKVGVMLSKDAGYLDLQRQLAKQLKNGEVKKTEADRQLANYSATYRAQELQSMGLLDELGAGKVRTANSLNEE